MYYGIVIADDMEYAPLADYAKTCPGFVEDVFHGRPSVTFLSEKGSSVRAVYSGVGKVNAAATTAFLIADGVDIILNSGMSGALNGDATGRLILAESAFEADVDLTVLGYKEFEKPKQEYVYHTDERVLRLAEEALPDARVAPVCCGDLFLTDRSRGEYLYNSYGAEAFDMESGAVASVCFQCGIPFVILRQISDGADENTVATYRQNNEHSLHVHLMADIHCINRFDGEKESF